MKISLCLATVLLAITTSLSAQESHTEYQFMGFSDDLRFCAFETYGIEETTAFSNLYFIDVDKNDYSTRPIMSQAGIEDTDPGDKELAAARAESQQKGNEFFTRYKIGGKKTGTLISFKGESTGFGIRYEPEQLFKVGNENYKLVLSQVGTGVTNAMGDEEQMVVVALEHNGQSKVLQPATKVPKSWGSVIGYQLLCVYYLQNKVAVFVECQGPAFEGVRSTFQMIVTGVLN